MIATAQLRIAGVRARCVEVPMRRPLAVSTGEVAKAPFVLVDLLTDDGPTGCAYVFVYAPWALEPVARLVRAFGELVTGAALAPLDVEATLQKRMRLLGAQGLALLALSAIDMAAWDALAKSHEVPLATLLGGSLLETPAYNSNGLGIIGTARAASEARELREGFTAIKVRLGYPDVETDVAVVRAVREAVGADVKLMSDYNQLLSTGEAIARGHSLDDCGLVWIEEPVACDDVAGHADVRRSIKTRVQTGENWWGTVPMAAFLQSSACDYVMPDAGKIGGVTGWLRAASLAHAVRVPMSSHLYPEVSAQLLAITPTRHWLEYVDWAEPVLQRGVCIENGNARPSAEPGIGIAWNEDAVRAYEVRA